MPVSPISEPPTIDNAAVDSAGPAQAIGRAVAAAVGLTIAWAVLAGATERHFAFASLLAGLFLARVLTSTPARRTWFPALAAVLAFGVGWCGDVLGVGLDLNWRYGIGAGRIADHFGELFSRVCASHAFTDWLFFVLAAVCAAALTAGRQATGADPRSPGRPGPTGAPPTPARTPRRPADPDPALTYSRSPILRATHTTPNAVAPGRSPSRPAPREVPDAVTVRASAGHAERLARLAAQHGRTAAGPRPANRSQLLNLAESVVCSDLELAVLALHGTNQFAAAARLASASVEAATYARALAIKHGIGAEPGDRHRYAVALRAFAAENRLLTQRADALSGWLGEHWDAQTGGPAGDGDFEPDAYLRLLAAEHRLAEADGEPAADGARAALWAEAHSLQISARRLAAWARVTAEWLCPGLDRIAPPWVTDPRLLTAGHTLIC